MRDHGMYFEQHSTVNIIFNKWSIMGYPVWKDWGKEQRLILSGDVIRQVGTC